MNNRRKKLEIKKSTKRKAQQAVSKPKKIGKVEQNRAEDALREAQEWFRATLYSIGDAVITTDREGRVRQMNPVAETLTGWKEAEARGKLISEVFHIINEETRTDVENPTARVLREGVVVGLANHSLLIAKDGTERPIADRGAPIRNEKGIITGVVLVFRDQTAERAAQRALQESEEKYRQIVFTSTDSIMIFDSKTKNFVEVNKAAEDLYGYSREEFLKMNILAITAEEKKTKNSFEKILRGELTHVPVRYHKKKDGTIFPVEISASQFDVRGQTFVCGVVRDITERKQAEKALQESEEKYRNLFEEALDAILVASAETGIIIECNRAATRLWGRTKSELVGQHQRTLHPPEEIEGEFSRTFKQHLREKEGQVLEAQIVTKNGEIKDMEIMANVFELGGQRLIQGIFHDVTERKRAEKARELAEEALKNEHRLLKSIVDTIPDHIYIKDREGRFILSNSGALKAFRVKKPERLIGKTDFDFLEKHDAERFFAEEQKLLRTGEAIVNKVIQSKDKKRWGMHTKVPLKDIQGKIIGLIGINRDITKIKQGEEALRVSEKKLKEAQRLGRIGHWEFDVETRQIRWSDIVFNIYERDPRLGPPTEEEEAEYYSPEDARKLRDCAQKTIETGEPYEVDVSVRLSGGKTVEVVAIGSPIKDSAGRITRLLGTVQDITERKRAEDQIRALLKEKEAMLREIHHRVKNNMQIISSLLNLQARQLKDEKLQTLLKESQSRIKSMALVHESFYKSEDMSHINISDYIEKIATHLLAFYKDENKQIRLKLDTEPIEIEIHRAIPCGLILNEMITNALKHAFPEKQDGEITISLHTSESGKCCLSVKDSGIGFPEKLDFRNTESLGMQIVMNLVDQLDGSIALRREQGTEFVIQF